MMCALPERTTPMRTNGSQKVTEQRVLKVFNELRKIRATIPLQYAYTFILVAENEGQSVQFYANLADVSQSVMTRNLLDLGERNRYKEPGFGLVMSRMDPLNMRRHQTFLTPKGHALWRHIEHAVNREPVTDL